MFETVATRIIGFINSAVLSGYSEDSVAAVGSANSIINFFPIIFSIISTGGTVIISNMIGAERLKRAFTATFTQITLCGFIGAVCGALMLIFSNQLMGFMNLEGAVLHEALIYYKIRAAAIFILAFTSGCSALLRCFGYAKDTVVINLISILISLVLNIFVIKFPNISPVTGVEGIAISTVVSQIISLALSVYYTRKRNIKFIRPKRFTIFLNYVKKMINIGFPAGISGSTFTLSQIISTSFIALIGTYALSAKVYYDNILCYAYLFSMSLGNANSLLVGRLVGAGNIERAKALNKALVKITVTVNLIISLLIAILYKPLISIFTENPLIIETALLVFMVDIIAEVSRGISQVYEYALRSAGDMKFMLIVVLISCWTISVGLAYFLSITCDIGIIGCYIAVAIDELIRAVAAFYRWQSNKWNRIKVY
ncbi:MAG: MATE family efflux transporter [Clostridia bacterium]|nr:MATE family efflux transporter [Clostridia bacterium]